MAARNDKGLPSVKSKLSTSTNAVLSDWYQQTTEGGDDVNRLESLLHGMMSCSLCGEPYTDPLRLPKSLPCTHTYCVVCLSRSLLDGVLLDCPDCGVRYDVGGNVNQLPNSAMVMAVLDKVCKTCRRMDKLEECAHCKRVSCTRCLASHLEQIRQELLDSVRQLSTLTKRLASKQNLIDAALLEAEAKAETMKTEVAAEVGCLADLIRLRHDRVVEGIDKELSKEKKRLKAMKKSLADEFETNMSLCNELVDQLAQPVMALAGRLNYIKNKCAVQMDKINREQTAAFSLEWELSFLKPDRDRIRKELDEMKVIQPRQFPPAVASGSQEPSCPANTPSSRVRGKMSNSLSTLAADVPYTTKSQNFTDHGSSFTRVTRGKSESSL